MPSPAVHPGFIIVSAYRSRVFPSLGMAGFASARPVKYRDGSQPTSAEATQPGLCARVFPEARPDPRYQGADAGLPPQGQAIKPRNNPHAAIRVPKSLPGPPRRCSTRIVRGAAQVVRVPSCPARKAPSVRQEQADCGEWKPLSESGIHRGGRGGGPWWARRSWRWE